MFLFSCGKNSVDNPNCKFLLDVGVNVPVNLNFYTQLQFPGNSIYIPNEGNAGIILINIGSGFLAWDASDPNHPPSACSAISASGFNATCGCDDGNTYDLSTGLSTNGTALPCPLKNYRIEQNGNALLIFN
jgi:hypothetical protein